MIRSVILVLTTIFFFLLPWYYGESGLIQPVDFAVGALGIIFLFLRFPSVPYLSKKEAIYKTMLFFSLYSIALLLADYIIDPKLVTALLLALNFYYFILINVFCILLFHLYHNYSAKQFYYIFIWFLLVDTVIPLIYLVKLGGFNSRISLSFNNPNQLGFYSIVNLGLFVYLTLFAKRENIAIAKKLSLVIININLIFLFLSVSRASYPAIALYIASYFLIFRTNFSGYMRWIFIFNSALVVGVGFLGIFYKIYQHMEVTREKSLTFNDSFFDDIYYRSLKGISHNFDNIRYFIFGTGNYTTLDRSALEFHNNFIYIFNQSGLLGLLIYVFLNLVIIYELGKKGILYLMPYGIYLFYSIFQYSYRTRPNWLFLAFIIFIIVYNRHSGKTKTMNVKQ